MNDFCGLFVRARRELVRSLRAQGDRAAFDPVFRRLWPLLRGFAGRFLPLEEADDVAQMAREGGERLGDALLVADIGHHAAKDGQSRALGGGHAQPRLVHQREQLVD